MFSGEDPAGWIAKAEVYFCALDTPDEVKIDLAKLCMDSDFFKSLIEKEEDEVLTWEGLKDVLLKRCGGDVSDGNV